MYTNSAGRSSGAVRQRLLEGAVRCLQSKGYADTTARDIVAESGANLRSIGYHFGSTRGLLLEALTTNFRRWLEPLIAAAADVQQPPVERLALGMRRFTAALPEHAPMCRAWLEAVVLAGSDPELHATLARNQEAFAGALAGTLRAGGHDDAKALEHARAIIVICDGLMVRYLLHGHLAEPAEIALGAAIALGRPGS